jgi:predicted ATPase
VPSYWPWIEVGRAYGGEEELAALDLPADVAVELGRIFLRTEQLGTDSEDATDPALAQFRLFDAYTSFIRAAAEQTPLVIVLDDLHWADKPSLLLLQHLARSLSGAWSRATRG